MLPPLAMGIGVVPQLHAQEGEGSRRLKEVAAVFVRAKIEQILANSVLHKQCCTGPFQTSSTFSLERTLLTPEYRSRSIYQQEGDRLVAANR